MVSFAFSLIFTVCLNLSKIGPFIMGGEIDHQSFVVTCQLLLILFDASFDDDIHEFISISFLIYFLTCFELLKGWVVKYFPSLFYINMGIPLLRMRKNLLKHNIFSSLSMFLFPGASLYSYLMVLIFSKDWISILFRMSETDGISIGGFSLSLFSSPFIFVLIDSNLLWLNSSNIFLKSECTIFSTIVDDDFLGASFSSPLSYL